MLVLYSFELNYHRWLSGIKCKEIMIKLVRIDKQNDKKEKFLIVLSDLKVRHDKIGSSKTLRMAIAKSKIYLRFKITCIISYV